MELLDQELAGQGGVLFPLLAGNSNALTRLDAGHFPRKAESLVVVPALEQETFLPGENASREAAVMPDDVSDSDSDCHTAAGDARYNPAFLDLGHTNLLGYCRYCANGQQGPHQAPDEDAAIPGRHSHVHFLSRKMG